MKPGVTTSEFWGGLAAPLAGVAALIHQFPDAPTRIAAIAGGTAVAVTYILSRMQAKRVAA